MRVKTKEEIKQFVLDTLLPYKKDRSLIALNSKGNCCYLTTDGRKCAVGKHLKENKEVQFFRGGAHSLFSKFGSGILTDEARAFDFTFKTWRTIQMYHDRLAYGGYGSLCNKAVRNLEERLDIDLTELKLN